MPTHESEAIVLRQYPLADSDSIVVCITPEFGKIRVVASGIKKPKNRFAGCLEPLNHIRIEFFLKEGRNLGKIGQAELIHSYSGRIVSLDRIFAYTYFTELVNTIAQENQSNPSLFRLLLSSLKAGENQAPVASLVRYFEVWSLKLSGLYPNYAYCSNCGKYVKEIGFFARIQDGCARCSDCARGNGVYIGSAASSALQSMMTHSPEDFAALPLEAEAGNELERLTQGLLKMNIEGPLKSYGILKDAL